jgi:hypothetical protein
MKRAIAAVAMGSRPQPSDLATTTFRRVADLQTAIWIRSRASNHETSFMGEWLNPNS